MSKNTPSHNPEIGRDFSDVSKNNPKNFEKIEKILEKIKSTNENIRNIEGLDLITKIEQKINFAKNNKIPVDGILLILNSLEKKSNFNIIGEEKLQKIFLN